MFSMSSQNTFGKVRLNDKVESRVRGDLYARFGGECLETYHCKKWQGAGCLAYDKILAYRVVDGKAVSTLIKVAPVNDGKEYIVLDGLKAGDEIVADGAGMIREGTQVK